MIKTIRFFRLDNDYKAGWYADVPNHTLAENEMVAGSYELWICNVTHDVLGEHPRSIYIHAIV